MHINIQYVVMDVKLNKQMSFQYFCWMKKKEKRKVKKQERKKEKTKQRKKMRKWYKYLSNTMITKVAKLLWNNQHEQMGGNTAVTTVNILTHSISMNWDIAIPY